MDPMVDGSTSPQESQGSVPREQQFTGSLIGQCLGDALGFVVEGHPPQACQRYVEEVLKTGNAGGHARNLFPFGQYSDDSQLARELLLSYLACGWFDPADYARRIALIFAEGRIVGQGESTTEAARRLTGGVLWEEAGITSVAPRNGGAMRAGPVGLLFFDDSQGIVQAAHDQCRITHKDRRCSAGAVAIAGAVALALWDKPIDATWFLSQLSEWTGKLDRSVASAIERLGGWMSLPPDEAASLVLEVGLAVDRPEEVAMLREGVPPLVTASVLWSLYSFLRSPEDYWETICTTIAVGGDVDTTAAMAGAMSGAYLGLEAIPEDLAQHLTDKGTWGFEELVGLGRDCYRSKVGL